MTSPASQIADFIRSNDRFLIASHVFPDGDNIGSMLALGEALEKLGKTYACYVEGDLPTIYAWMPGAQQIREGASENAVGKLQCAKRCPTLLLVDSSDLQRMGDSFGASIETAEVSDIANVDHHVTNTDSGL